MEPIIQLSVRIFASVLLLFVMGFCGLQLFRLWFDRTPVIAPFDYTLDGQPRAESGQAFARLLAQDLAVVQNLFTDGTEENLVPSSHQLGLGHKVYLPSLGTSPWNDVQIEAYGVKLSAAFQALFRWMRSPCEISGAVVESREHFSVHGTLRRGPRSMVQTRWFLDDIPSRAEASFALACRLFRNAVAGTIPAFSRASDQEFCSFTNALRYYDLYRAHLLDGRAEEAGKALESAASRVDVLLDRQTVWPIAWKLGGYIAREQGNLTRARELFTDYLEATDEEDDKIREILKELKVPEAPPAAEPVAPSADTIVRPGTRIGVQSADPAQTVTLCCIAREGMRRVMIAPAAAMVGPAESVVFALDALGTKRAVGKLPRAGEQDKAPPEPRGLLAIPLDDGVKADNLLRKNGGPERIAGFADPRSLLEAGPVIVVSADGCRQAKVISVAPARRVASVAQQQGKPVLSRPPVPVVRIERVTKPGDAGAAVVTKDGHLVGMVIAADDTTAHVLPLAELFLRRGLKLEE